MPRFCIFAPFFAAIFLAVWPCWKKHAPYAFWLVAIGVWTMAGIAAVLATQLLRFILDRPL